MPDEPVTFTDNNPIPAQIHVASAVSGNPTFDLALKPYRPGQIRTFPQPELMIPVTLANSPETSAYINVIANPYFTISGPEGYFRLRNLPPGTYTLSAIRPGSPVQTQTVTIQSGAATKVRFTFAVAPSSASDHN